MSASLCVIVKHAVAEATDGDAGWKTAVAPSGCTHSSPFGLLCQGSGVAPSKVARGLVAALYYLSCSFRMYSFFVLNRSECYLAYVRVR